MFLITFFIYIYDLNSNFYLKKIKNYTFQNILYIDIWLLVFFFIKMLCLENYVFGI